MKNYFLKTLAFLFFIVLNASFVKAQNAETILQKMDNLMSAPKDKEAIVQIIVENKTGKEKIREAELKQKGMDKKLYRYTKPEKKAGIATLSLPDGKMWLYMPSFGKPIKISLLSKSQSFTGTDFSYEDISGIPYNVRYNPKLLESEDSNTYRLELTPKDKKMEYSKIIITLDKDHFYPKTMDFYNKGNTIKKTATYSYLKKGKYWYAQEVLMVDIKKEHSTKIVMLNVKFDQGISDELFLVENLKQNK